MTSPILSLNALSKFFNTFTAVNNVTLEVSGGEIYGFLGPNGAGKTTTIKMITGLLKPSSGTVSINGYSLDAAENLCR